MPLRAAQALYDSNASNLKAWLFKCPRKQFTTLDTHDGLGVVDVADIMTEDQVNRTYDNIMEKGTKVEKKYSTSEYGNLDTYQVRAQRRWRWWRRS
jgi:sucrose phosphorylase